MRINLVTPFAEKDAVKALGARWDSAKKVWYINDVADLTPFVRWIPGAGAVEAPASPPRGVTTGPTLVVSHCDCDVLPWDDCPHTSE